MYWKLLQMTFVQEAQFSLLGGWGESPHWSQICSFPPPGKIPPQQIPLTKAVVFGPVPFLFLTSYSLYTQVLQILIFIDIQYIFTNVVFSFEKGQNSQNHFSSDSHHQSRIPPPFNAIWKTQTKCYFFQKCAPKNTLMPQCLEQAMSFLVFYFKFRLSSVCEYELAPILITKPILLGTSNS